MFTERMQGNVLDEDHLAVVFLEAYLQVTGPDGTLLHLGKEHLFWGLRNPAEPGRIIWPGSVASEAGRVVYPTLSPICIRSGSGWSAPPFTVTSSKPFSKSAVILAPSIPSGRFMLRRKRP